MTTLLQLNPPIPVVTPKGDGMAVVVIDYGPALNSIWIVILDDSHKFIHVDSAELLGAGNEMWDMKHPEPMVERNV
jgi:hypothetical protein